MIKDGMVSLPGGADVPFRLIRPDDVPALQRFHERLSEKTIYLRFFGSLQELPEAKANYIAHIDGVDHLAFVALDPDDPGEIIALVRYDRGPGSERAEYAALVEDRWQGHGVGIGLTRRLVDEARAKGVRFFYAMVMGKNKRMLGHPPKLAEIMFRELRLGVPQSPLDSGPPPMNAGSPHRRPGVPECLVSLCSGYTYVQ